MTRGNEAPGIAIGITGGIACGKSSVGQILEQAGVAVLDTDRVAHDLMVPGAEVYPRVVDTFGQEILDDEGAIDRKKLGAIVFADDAARERLNGLVHPAVSRAWRQWRAKQQAAGKMVAVMIPLLFEVGADDGWDAIWVVAAPEQAVLSRLAERGLSENAARQRVASQMSQEEKMKRANFVIVNDGSMIDLKRMTLQALQELQQKKGDLHHE